MKNIKVLLATLILLTACDAKPKADEGQTGQGESPPLAPVLSGVLPAVLANDNAPKITGHALAGATVTLYVDAACTTALSQGVVDTAGAFSIEQTVNDNTTQTFYAKASNAFGESPCSTSSVTYQEDSVAPALPVVIGVTPSATANNNSPVVAGNAEALSSILVYSDAACVTSMGNGTTSANGQYAITIPVADNSQNSFYVKSTDRAGNSSACSSTHANYTEDSLAPVVPVLTGTTPTSPSNQNVVAVRGTSESKTLVWLYNTSACTAPITSITTNEAGEFSFSVTLNENATSSLYAKAQDSALNESACSVSPLVFVEDSLPPEVSLSGVAPTGPANNNNPVAVGTSQALTAIDVYSNGACTAKIASGMTDGAGNFSIPLTVSDNSTTSIYVSGRDAAGNVSACSNAVVSYVEDSAPPGVPIFVAANPNSPSNSNTPTIQGLAEARSVVDIYSNSQCTALVKTLTASGAGGFEFDTVVADNSTTSFFAKATDVAGNVSTCSSTAFTYIEDSVVPAKPVLVSVVPESPSDVNTPTLSGTAEARATVQLFTDAGCLPPVVATGRADSTGAFTIATNVMDKANVGYSARAVDQAGNLSECSTTRLSYQNYTSGEGVALLTGSLTTAPSGNTNLNQTTAYPMKWDNSFFHSAYYAHSRLNNNHQLRVKVAGRYRVTVNVPQIGVVTNGSIRTTVRVNGVDVDTARGDSFISNAAGHNETSTNLTILLPTVAVNDVIDVVVLRSGNAGTITVKDNASLFVEYIAATRPIFMATSVASTNSTDLNQTTAYPLAFTSVVKDAVFAHSATVNPDRIVVNQAGNYLTNITIPLEGTLARTNVKMSVEVNGTTIPGGLAKQGYVAGVFSRNRATLSWSGLVRDLKLNDIIRVKVIREGGAGKVTVTPLSKASIVIERLADTTGLYAARGGDLSLNTNWNNAVLQDIKWSVDDVRDSSVYSHSTSSASAHQVIVTQSGDYLLYYNDSLSSTNANTNVRVQLRVGGILRPGVITSSHYVSTSNGHGESSGTMVYYLRDLEAGTVISMGTQQEAANGTVDDDADAFMMLLKKPLSTIP